MKAALRRALVPFYPIAGRLKRDESGRLEIDCNAKGVLFVEAESPDAAMDDLRDFTQTVELMRLIPSVDYSKDISTLPLLLLQVTHYVGIQHYVVDGYSCFHFIKTWSVMAQGLDINFRPFINRTLLRARNPPQPQFDHVEYHPPPSLKVHSNVPQNYANIAVRKFKITKDQLNALKAISKVKGTTYSSFVILISHIWRSACKARNLSQDQETKFYIGVDGRARLQPTLPHGYLGSSVFWASPVVGSGDLESKPLWYTASIIHKALVRIDNDYLRSALDYLETQSVLDNIIRGANKYKCPNLGVLSWIGLSIYDADFGWGRPIYVGPAGIGIEGLCYVLPSSTYDGSLLIMISLETEHMKRFEELFYDFESSFFIASRY